MILVETPFLPMAGELMGVIKYVLVLQCHGALRLVTLVVGKLPFFLLSAYFVVCWCFWIVDFSTISRNGSGL